MSGDLTCVFVPCTLSAMRMQTIVDTVRRVAGCDEVHVRAERCYYVQLADGVAGGDIFALKHGSKLRWFLQEDPFSVNETNVHTTSTLAKEDGESIVEVGPRFVCYFSFMQSVATISRRPSRRTP